MSQNTSIGEQRTGSRDDLATAIVAVAASARQRQIALGVLILFLFIAIENAPFSRIELGPAHSFVSIIEALMCAANLLTAVFLFVQYSIYPERALLVLAGGFVFGGLFALLHTLAFPSAHGSAVLIGDTLNSPTWLFGFWQTAFPLAIIAYALSKGRGDPVKRPGRAIRIEVGATIACVFVVTTALTWVATAGAGYLPPLHKSLILRTPYAVDVSEFVTLLNVAALAVLFVRRYTLLDQWLMVTLVAWLPNLVMASLFSSVRFSEVWYLTRIYALLAGSSLLVVLLTETLLLHRRYEQYQKGLIAELDHRVKNVLAQIAVVARSTREGSRSIDEFLESLDGRIQSMAAAHTLLSKSGWQSVRLHALVRNEFAPYATGSNVTISGPDVLLNSAETQAVARVLHELAGRRTRAAEVAQHGVSRPNSPVASRSSSKRLDPVGKR